MAYYVVRVSYLNDPQWQSAPPGETKRKISIDPLLPRKLQFAEIDSEIQCSRPTVNHPKSYAEIERVRDITPRLLPVATVPGTLPLGTQVIATIPPCEHFYAVQGHPAPSSWPPKFEALHAEDVIGQSRAASRVCEYSQAAGSGLWSSSCQKGAHNAVPHRRTATGVPALVLR